MKKHCVKEYASCYVNFNMNLDNDTDGNVYVGVLHDGNEEIITEEVWAEWGDRLLLKSEIDKLERE